jgi:uncharacterized membrane protein
MKRLAVRQLRNAKDRLRHAVIYELVGLILAVPLAAWGFGTDLVDTGILGIFFSVLAMIWNMIYNHYFDILMLKNGRDPARRGFWLRAVHALLFEAGFIIVSVPAIAWWLSLSLARALAMDLGFTIFYIGYTYVYNWVYDWIFPYPDFSHETKAICSQK